LISDDDKEGFTYHDLLCSINGATWAYDDEV
jgi:hypothetical protein